MLKSVYDLKILTCLQIRDQISDGLRWNDERVDEEEFEIGGGSRVFVQEKVAVALKHLAELTGFFGVNCPISELNVHSCFKLIKLDVLSDQGRVLLAIEVIEAARSHSIHHHLVNVRLRVLTS